MLLFALFGCAADLLWFVPGVRYLERRMRAAAERAADAWAVGHGADPLNLAAALLATAEQRAPWTVCVHALLAGPAPRRTLARRMLGALPSLLLTVVAIQSCFFAYR